MILTLAILALLLILIFFIWDSSGEQGITSQFETSYQPFEARTVVKHDYRAKPQQIWSALTSFSNYPAWFPGISRLLPVVETDRYVHQFSFDRFQLEPGAYLRLRPVSAAPAFKSRVLTVEKEKHLAFELKFNPFNRELVTFHLEPNQEVTSVTCTRQSKGLFSFLTLWGFAGRKSRILDNLSYHLPEDRTVSEKAPPAEAAALTAQLSVPAQIAQAVQAALDGNMDPINAISDKTTRGKAKSALVKAKRAGGKLPEDQAQALKEEPTQRVGSPTQRAGSTALSAVSPTQRTSSPTPQAATQPAPPTADLPAFEDPQDLINYVVNLALDGNLDPINAIPDKATRGKAKSALVKAKRSGEAPPMPENIPTPAEPVRPPTETAPTEIPSELVRPLAESTAAAPDRDESEEELFARLVKAGLEGNTDEINALENKALRGKIKTAIIKAKREQAAD